MEELPRSDGWELSPLLIDAGRSSPLWGGGAPFPRQVVQDHRKKRAQHEGKRVGQ